MSASLLLLAFGLAAGPGLAAYLYWRGPSGAVVGSSQPGPSLAEAAVLRDGAVGHTRWAFAALVVRLARDGHCTLVRTRRRRWLRMGPVVAVDLHADPTALSTLERTVLRQLGRHDTLDGFGFAGSTFRRRTLRDVRAALVKRGWLHDRHRRSTAVLGGSVLLLAGGLLLAAGLLGPAGERSLLGAATAVGLGTGGLFAGRVRYPCTREGARRRAAHRAHAARQVDRVRTLLADAPERAADVLIESLPVLILERRASPRTLRAWADRFEAADIDRPPPDWVRDEETPIDSFAGACRRLAGTLGAMGAGPWWAWGG